MKHRPSENRRAAALVTTLAALLLLTVTVLAFFSLAALNRRISFSSTNQTKAEHLARSTVDALVGELREEIRNGSIPMDAQSVALGAVFLPDSELPFADRAIVPRRSGVSGTDPLGSALIRKMSSDTDGGRMFPAGRALASGIPTSTASANGRTIPLGAWFDTEAGGPGLGNSSVTPTWCYISRSSVGGVPVFPAAANPDSGDFVIGRFAYVVYDVGSQLDINVAGHPTAPTITEALEHKGSPVLADLTALPGTTTAQADALVSWRNGGISPADFLRWMEYEGPRVGFLQTPVGMNQFLSRRELIESARAGNRGLSPANLGYFTHFSRALNQPGYAPTYNAADRGGENDIRTAGNQPTPLRGLKPGLAPRPNGYAYRDNATLLRWDNQNQFTVAPRFTEDKELTRYRFNPDAPLAPIQETIRVRKGDPIITERFPLDRLRWLENFHMNTTPAGQGPTGVRKDAILKHFGLIWETANMERSTGHWAYVSPDGEIAGIQSNPFSRRILSLDEVAELNREPDFFELLKAAILRGSIGDSIDNNFSRSSGGIPDESIIQIGISIIGQVEPSSFPVFIRIGRNAVQTTSNYRTSLENIPYPYKWHTSIYRPPAGVDGQNADNDDWVHLLMQVEMWNPFQRALSSDSSEQAASSSSPHRPLRTGVRIARGPGSNLGGNVWAFDDLSSLPGTDPTKKVARSDTSYFANIESLANPLPSTTAQRRQMFVRFNAGDFREPTLITDSMNVTQIGEGMNLIGTNRSPSGFAGLWLGRARIPAANPMTGLPVSDIGAWFGTDGTQADSGAVFHSVYTMADGTPPGNNSYLMAPISNSLYLSKRFVGKPSADSYRTMEHASSYALVDPLTHRFGISELNSPNFGQSLRPSSGALTDPNFSFRFLIPQSFTWTTEFMDRDKDRSVRTGDMVPVTPSVGLRAASGQPDNQSVHLSLWSDNKTGQGVYYTDNDRVVRRGDSDLANGVDPMGTTANARAARPIVLNRPLRNTGEMGFAHRGQPWRTVNFATTDSGDAGLLEMFAPRAIAPVTAGLTSLNSTLPETLAAHLQGTILQPRTQDVPNPGSITPAQATQIADSIASHTANQPLESRAALITDWDGRDIIAAALGSNGYIKHRQEAVTRALADATEARTWNLMIDVVVQAGRFAPSESSAERFTVEGERRYWVFVAIDRLTAQVIDTKWEPVQL